MLELIEKKETVGMVMLITDRLCFRAKKIIEIKRNIA